MPNKGEGRCEHGPPFYLETDGDEEEGRMLSSSSRRRASQIFSEIGAW